MRHLVIRVLTLLVCAAFPAACSTQSPVHPTERSNRIISPSAGFGVIATPATTAGSVVNLASCLGSARTANCISMNRVVAGAAGSVSAPNAPRNFAASAIGGNVTLTWDAPIPQDSPVTEYVIEAGSFPGAADLADFSTGNVATSFSASGVGSGTYYVRTRAKSAGGLSAPSNEVTLVVGGGPCAAPGPPSGLALTSNAGGTIVLTWAPGSGSPTSYLIEAGSGPGLTNLANSDLGLATTLTATGVGAGTYYVRVRAKNGCGTSGPSNELTIVVGGAVPPPTGPVVSASIDGAAWSAASINASFTNGRLAVGGTNPLWSVDFNILATGPGTYAIASTDPSFAFLLSNANLQPGRPVPKWQTQGGPGIGGGSGSVTVTTLTSGGASGTFVFTVGPYLLTGATGTKSITGGVFNVSFR
jgi:uncharacterized protein DUF6252/fibronectin type III domain protein